MISAVDLLQGIAKLGGLEIIHVDGATGFFMIQNYKGKGRSSNRGTQEP